MTATMHPRARWPGWHAHHRDDESDSSVLTLIADTRPVVATVASRTGGTVTWHVTIAARGDGEPVTPVLASRFVVALHERGAQVSTASALARTCYYEARITVTADGVLTAILHAIERFQSAARIAGLPAVRIVGITTERTQS